MLSVILNHCILLIITLRLNLCWTDKLNYTFFFFVFVKRMSDLLCRIFSEFFMQFASIALSELLNRFARETQREGAAMPGRAPNARRTAIFQRNMLDNAQPQTGPVLREIILIRPAIKTRENLQLLLLLNPAARIRNLNNRSFLILRQIHADNRFRARLRIRNCILKQLVQSCR